MTRGNAPAMRPGSLRPTGAGAVMASRDPLAQDVDFFPTRPWAARAGAEIVRQIDPRARSAWECAVGPGHMAHGLRDYFPTVHGSDVCVYDAPLHRARGWGVFDFTAEGDGPFRADWIITNPPFDHIETFIERAWDRADRGVALLLRAVCLEGQARHRLLHVDCPLTVFAPFSERVPMHKGFWDESRSTATAYAWFLWCKPGVGPRLPVICGKRRPLIFDIPPGAEARLTRPDDAPLFEATNALPSPKGTQP